MVLPQETSICKHVQLTQGQNKAGGILQRMAPEIAELSDAAGRYLRLYLENTSSRKIGR